MRDNFRCDDAEYSIAKRAIRTFGIKNDGLVTKLAYSATNKRSVAEFHAMPLSF